jgi:hypothetical protein
MSLDPQQEEQAQRVLAYSLLLCRHVATEAQRRQFRLGLTYGEPWLYRQLERAGKPVDDAARDTIFTGVTSFQARADQLQAALDDIVREELALARQFDTTVEVLFNETILRAWALAYLTKPMDRHVWTIEWDPATDLPRRDS